MKKCLVLLFCIFLGALPVRADIPYLDDRSTPESLVRSLYNAINRKDYARAHGYFSVAPAKSLKAYVKGFDKTKAVELVLGVVASTERGGVITSIVPVSLRSVGQGDEDQEFVGCYTVTQRPDKPLLITDHALKSPAKDTGNGVTHDCGSGLNAETEVISLEQATAVYLALHSKRCDRADEVAAGLNAGQKFDFEFRDEADAAATPVKVQLFAFPCSMAAYNSTEVYFIKTPFEALSPVSFASPDFKIEYADAEQSKLNSITLAGFGSDLEVMNSAYDESEQTISSFSKWRGVGDASSSTSYRFDLGRFELWTADVDPTYDGVEGALAVLVDGEIQPEFLK